LRTLHILLSTLAGLLSLAIVALGWLTVRHTFLASPILNYEILAGIPVHVVVSLTPFGGLFLCMLGIVGVLAAVYGIGYGQQYESRRYGVWLDVGLLGFLLSMAAVFVAANVFTFILAWELMSIVSYMLVVYDYHDRENVKSGLIYASMTQLGAAFLLAAFFILHAYTGSYEFAVFARSASTIPPMAQDLAFLSAFVGFAAKAGVMPLHIWLPRAHPAAPSHVSALMSGVMIKTALYGFLLVSVFWLHAPFLWWGVLVAGVGAVSAVLGALHAGQETNLKRILAYSSIDNMGLLFLGTGMTLIELALQQPVLAGFTLTATIYQAFNHAFFKSLLFHGAGAVIHAAHTASLNRLGGLIKTMPWTSALILGGLLSFSALPPGGAFVSEWMLFSAFARSDAVQLHSVVGAVAMLALLAFLMTGALTVFSALRIFGVGFLADARSEGAAKAREAPITMRISLAMGLLVIIAAGVWPPAAVNFIASGLPRSLQFHAWRLWYGFDPHLSMWSIPILYTAIAAAATLAWLLPRLYLGRTDVTRVQTWTCGGKRSPAMSYTASGFSQPVQRVFHAAALPLAIRYLYRPLWQLVFSTTTIFRRVQNGHVRAYLLYLFMTVLVLLVVAR